MKVTYTEFRTNMKKYLDHVSATGEEVIISRVKGEDVMVVRAPHEVHVMQDYMGSGIHIEQVKKSDSTPDRLYEYLNMLEKRIKALEDKTSE